MPIDQFPVDHWGTDQGLPQASIEAMLQTSDGYLWIGTQEGLARFDGVSFTPLSLIARSVPEHTFVHALLEDSSGTIWIGTEGGLMQKRGDLVTVLTAAQGLADNAISVLLEGTDSTIWVGTDGGLSRIVGEQIESITTADGLPHRYVRALAIDQDGRLWIGTGGGGVAILENSELTIVTTRDGLSNDEVLEIFAATDGSIWVGTRNGLSCWRNGRFETYGTSDGLAHETIWEILEDRQGRLWIGTSGGLSRLDQGRFSSLLDGEDGLSHHIVWSLLEDHEGSLWVGTASGGINRLRDTKLVSMSRREGLTSEFIWTVLEDDRGVIWLGTEDGGLNRIEGDRITALTTHHGLADDEVLALHQDRSGRLWVGTRRGLSCIDNDQVVAVPGPAGELTSAIRVILEDRQGDLWIGTSGSGLHHRTQTTWSVLTVDDGLLSDDIRCLHQDRQGALWIGTAGGGLSRLQDGDLRSYSTDEGLPGRCVLSIHEDLHGALWLGTTAGLARMANGMIYGFTAASGLHDKVVYQVLEDQEGLLWLSSNHGIHSIAREQLEEVVRGARDRVSPMTLGQAEGMRSNECNGGSQPSGWIAGDGRLWFPTMDGAVIINPTSLQANQMPPPVVIESLVVDGRPFDLADQVSCPPGSKHFELSYSALSFIAPERIRFRYRLDPYDRDWIEVIGRRSAHYTGVPPGSYRFRLKAISSDGVASHKEAVLALEVRPFFYQTVWFGTTVVMLAVALIMLAFALRLRQVMGRCQAVLAERQRMAREIHDTLAQGLTAISLQLEGIDETLEQDPDSARDHLERARQVVTCSLAEARRTVWNLRSRALESSSLEGALAQIADQLTAGTTITTRIEVAGRGRPLSSELEESLLRIGQEAITNAVRHAGCTSINIHLRRQRQSVCLRITDDGCGVNGLDHRADGIHFGLQGMQERVDAMGGRLTVASRPSCGVVVETVIPTGRSRSSRRLAVMLGGLAADKASTGVKSDDPCADCR
jgi:ligand-binding sensor domain-containing protein/signal transduction histidine kinase